MTAVLASLLAWTASSVATSLIVGLTIRCADDAELGGELVLLRRQ